MISKELLSLIVGYKVTYIEIKPKISNKQRIFYCFLDEDDIECEEFFCIEMLGRLCKEWCDKKGYSLSSTCTGRVLVSRYWYNKRKRGVSKKQDKELFKADTEVEAIIKATEWVAREKGLIT